MRMRGELVSLLRPIPKIKFQNVLVMKMLSILLASRLKFIDWNAYSLPLYTAEHQSGVTILINSQTHNGYIYIAAEASTTWVPSLKGVCDIF